MPSLSSIDGLGEKAADGIVFAAEDGPFLSKEDFIEPLEGDEDSGRSDGRSGAS